MRSRVPLGLLAVVLTSAAPSSGCSSSEETVAKPAVDGELEPGKCFRDSNCTETTVCDRIARTCVAHEAGSELGKGDGSPASVTLALVTDLGAKTKPTDLGFHYERPWELWIVGQGDNSAHRGTELDTDHPQWIRIVDPAARHFMHKPPALAMADGNEWASCGDNDNGQAVTDQIPNFFTGPSLFSADLDVFGKKTPKGLGSHLDMLHASPFCRGIAHVKKREYWVFNSYDKSLDRYDFHQDHGPGEDDHSDGTIFRYAAGQVKGADDGTPSHLAFDPTDKMLYVADTGNARIVKLDTTKGVRGGDLPRRNEPLADQCVMDGTNVEVVVTPGVVQRPSGLEVRGGFLYVTDAATSTFFVFDKSGKEVKRLATGLPERSLAGFAFGPDQKIWFVDSLTGRVLRIDPR